MTSVLRQFAVRWIPVLAALALIALFCRLGVWQLQRAAEKDGIEAEFQAMQAAPLLRLERYTEQTAFQPVVIDGRWLPNRTLLLDNQVRDKQAGVHVFNALKPDGGGPVVLVNRGWQPLPDRQRLPEVEPENRPVTLAGRLHRPPSTGIVLGEQVLTNASRQLITRIDRAQLSDWFGEPVADQVLLATGPAAFTSDWKPNFMPASRHRGYAFQWFALALTVFLVTAILQLRRLRKKPAK